MIYGRPLTEINAMFYSDTLGFGGNSQHWGEDVGGLCPQRVPGAEPLVRGFGGRSPPEAGSFLLHK